MHRAGLSSAGSVHRERDSAGQVGRPCEGVPRLDELSCRGWLDFGDADWESACDGIEMAMVVRTERAAVDSVIFQIDR